MNHAARQLIPAALLALCAQAASQTPADVLRVFEPFFLPEIHLVDTNGTVVHAWPTSGNLNGGIALSDDGTVFRRIYGMPNRVQQLALDGSLLWDYPVPAGLVTHHDIEIMPNGNVLLIGQEVKSRVEAIAQGRNPATFAQSVIPDYLIEVQPTGPTSGTIVWEWHIWDHLIQDFDPQQANFGVVANHPELLDLNYATNLILGGELNHANGIDYDPIHDWIVISAPVQDEIWIIDHGTTTAEAAGHTGGRWGKGGDLLYRWGNPETYRAGPASAKMLEFQHDPRFIPPGYPGAGNVTIFDNNAGVSRSGVVEIALPLDPSGNFILAAGGAYGPPALVWSYTQATGFFSSIASSAERLPNGNTLICSAKQGWIFEVTPAGQRVWEHLTPVGAHFIFSAHHTPRSLWTDRESLSASAGGTVEFDLIAGSQRAGDVYVLLGSASGSSPGFTANGINVPLNIDGYLTSVLGLVGSGVFGNWVGTLDASGRATANYTLPRLPFLTGLTLHHAMLTIDATTITFDNASNSVPLRFAP